MDVFNYLFEKLNRYLIAFIFFMEITYAYLYNVTAYWKNILFGSSSCQQKVVLVRRSSSNRLRLSKFVQNNFSNCLKFVSSKIIELLEPVSLLCEVTINSICKSFFFFPPAFAYKI